MNANDPRPRTPPVPDLQGQANLLQRRAARPTVPVWVGASAGSGKTRVLVSRLLRLMLPADGRPAGDPAQILCITFTKAGASEVMDRVVGIARGWTIAETEKLEADLRDLLETEPDAVQVRAARALFARIIETPGGMKVMTIHAFCQSVLARFPLEAGITPGFEVMQEGEARSLMQDARRAVIMRLSRDLPGDAALKDAFGRLGTLRNADQIEQLMQTMFAHRGRLRALETRHRGVDGLCAAVDRALNIPANMAARDAAVAAFFAALPADDIRHLASRLGNDNATNQKKAAAMASVLAATDRPAQYEAYRAAFLTQKGAVAVPNGLLKNDDTLLGIYMREGERFQRLDALLRAIATADATKSLLRFSLAALDAYEREKRARNRLDFEDLIDRTRALLSGGRVAWVQYKLDQGIRHILVDEAQDTNPDQWDIITTLSDEFYAGAGAHDAPRTTFVVGDEKQSIFSFQRADPRVFAAMREHLAQVTAPTPAPLQVIPMRISFRSAPSILRMVDETFAPERMRVGVLQDPAEPMRHEARYTGKGGRVELWPLILPPEKPARDAWSLPLDVETPDSPVVQMARRLAASIRRLLDDPAETLFASGRRIRPGDIMILLGKRKPLAEAVLKALRAENIPVSGIDRMVVSRQLAVRDCLAAMAFALQPEDDLNLAALLKSPFVGWSEDRLFTLAHGRTGSLWNAVRACNDAVCEWLSGLLALDAGGPSVFLHRLLFSPCPADPVSGMRALRGRLGGDVRDPLQELLARADAHHLNDIAGLQGFLQDALTDESELKRDAAEGADHVRVMTVHGSKGLEAPIVFLPDTVRTTSARTLRDPVLWPERGDDAGVPLWAANAETAADAWRLRADALKTRGDEEQRRLLYVALTRAGERLYIGGAQTATDGKTDRENSWYFACREAMERIGRRKDGDVLLLENPQTDPLSDKKSAKPRAAETPVLPAWMFEPAPAPENPPRPLAPSRPEQDDPAVISPLFGDISHRYLRGRLIHTLFQFLPDLPASERRERAAAWLRQPGHGIDAAAQAEIVKSVFAVLEDPAFAPLFTPAGRAEVPLTGLLGPDSVVAGQIDRLLITDDAVTVIDYKTNRPAPKNPADVPEAYRRQMRTYRDLLAAIWPGRPVRCALLWTDGPRLMDISDSL